MFPSAIIKKGKKSDVPSTKKASGFKLKGIEDMEEMMPKEKFEVSEGPEKYEVEKSMKVPQSKVPSANKAKPEDAMSIDLMLQSSKKKVPSANSAAEKDTELKEIKSTNSAYLDKIKKMKSRGK